MLQEPHCMKARPILFSGPMVRALLAGTKTQTRRIMKPQPEPTPADYMGPAGHWWPSDLHQSMLHVEEEMQKWTGLAGHCCPYGKPGDLLWVRETFSMDDNGHEEWPVFRSDGAPLPVYPPTRKSARWTPSIHMPRRHSRLTLRITDVRVQRLQEIVEADAQAEGAPPAWLDEDDGETVHAAAPPTYRRGFARLWRSINGPTRWPANPWVWALSFEVIHANVDQVLATKQAA